MNSQSKSILSPSVFPSLPHQPLHNNPKAMKPGVKVKKKKKQNNIYVWYNAFPNA